MPRENDLHLQNKLALQEAFAALAEGNRGPFGALMDEDARWTIIGTTAWSGTYRGLRQIRDELLGPLFAQFADTYTNTAHRFIAEDDYVAVECRGRVSLHSGKPYNNTYCYICRFENGKIKELTEYMDTQLVEEVLDAPTRR